MFDNKNQFYPTPTNLVNKMLDKVDFNRVRTVLEPSAGSGSIAEGIKERIKRARGYYNRSEDYDIDTVEIDDNLQHILKGKGFRVVHDDFLTYHTFKRYDAIILNPPFLNGDKHLLKAIKMQEKGGQIVCILNAETLLNPHSNTRKDLIRKLEEYDAEIEYIQNAFSDAERQTQVEIALITIDIPKVEYNSTIINDLKQEEQHEREQHNRNHIVNADFIQGIVDRYNFEIKAGLKLIAEYQALTPYIMNSLQEGRYASPILKLELYSKDNSNTIEDSYIKQIRAKYWEVLFASKEFIGMFTSDLREKYYDKISELREYDFSLYNIYSIKEELSKQLVKGIEDTIIDLFDELSHKYSYLDDKSPNIHYYNGWKTTKAHKINKRVIIRLNGFDNYSGRPYYKYNVRDKLMDIEKVFNYLDGGITDHIDLLQALQEAEDKGQTKKIDTKYFYVTFYKKGSCHIEFKNLELLKKFNYVAGKSKCWLPPSYGSKDFNSMSKDERDVVNSFEGEKSYGKLIMNGTYTSLNLRKTLMIG